VTKGKVTVAPGTPGARVYLVEGGSRRELPVLPISFDVDTTHVFSLEATKPGYVDYAQAIRFDDGQAEREYVVTLAPKVDRQKPCDPPYTTDDHGSIHFKPVCL
jgi:hypothetical protein